MLVQGFLNPAYSEEPNSQDPIKQAFPNIDAPPTTRNIEPFYKIKKDMSPSDIIKICGYPDIDIGSGFFIWLYKLNDNSSVTIRLSRSPINIMYIVHHKMNKNVTILEQETTN